ncbi:S8 family serine peptidase [Actinoplanes subtropicus]|uniref:S8 family serine peptidase n=1 Tax=Actinoplanes subtropicus TaxID=543632 RepID=UPI0004C3E33E|nr:S8 family serine peptidase [Actinoplanes subtropicus]
MKQTHRFAATALAAGLLAGGAAVAVTENQHQAPYQTPFGLSATPDQIVPTTVTPTHPVRVVSTTLDPYGRPVVSASIATDRKSATALVSSAQHARNALGVELDAPITMLSAPAGDDTLRDDQWDLTKIHAMDAWASSTGSGVTVAVIDTGVDATHEDLAGQVLPGMDFVTGVAGAGIDPNGHGTFVAGTIAAITGNGLGISAIAPDAKILPVRVLDAAGNGFMSNAARAIVWAADNGANVINMSFGSITRSLAVSAAVSYARGKGVVIVAAGGNGRAMSSPVTYPAADPGVIAVAATDSSDTIAAYSSSGSYIDVAAPGNAIESTTTGGTYASMFGTSLAAAHVSGVAALVAARQPSLTPDEIEEAIEENAVDRGARGKDKDFGYGRIDAAAAVTGADTIAGTPAPSASTSPAPIASPSRTVAKSRATVSVIASKSAVSYDTATSTVFTVTVGGRAAAARPVQLCIADPGQAFICSDTTTSASGKVVLTRTADASYQVLLFVPATDTAEAATSAVATYVVRAEVTVTKTAPGTISIDLTGDVGQVVQIQRLVKGKWMLVTAYRAVPNHTVSNLTKGQQYRVVVPDTLGVTGATSKNILT